MARNMWMILICVCLASLLSESLAFLNIKYNSAMNQYLNEINKFKTGQYSMASGQAPNNGFSYATNEYGKYFAFPVNTMKSHIQCIIFQGCHIHSNIAAPNRHTKNNLYKSITRKKYFKLSPNELRQS